VSDQAEFKGWARVEVMGHQSHIGYVTTEAYGQAVLFRIDQPAIAGGEDTLATGEWVGDVFAGAGSVVQRTAIEAASVLVGSGSIYRIVPCDEATAMAAIRANQRRPLMLVKLVASKQLVARRDPFDGDEDDEEASRANA
jgi:hypothetical protein